MSPAGSVNVVPSPNHVLDAARELGAIALELSPRRIDVVAHQRDQ